MKCPFILDIGGEGRHPAAWNLNPRALKTIGPCRGEPIPRLIYGRGECIPLPCRSVDLVIVERTPLRSETLYEIRRVAKTGALVILRHAPVTWFDPHRIVPDLLPGRANRTLARIEDQILLETMIELEGFGQGANHSGLARSLRELFGMDL